jgi:hypothetical protein
MDGERVRLGIHIRKMNSPGSPVYRTSENVVPAAAILIGSFAATAIHFYLGAAVLAVGCWWWIARILPQIREAVFLRASAYVLESDAHFDQMWARGMLSLYTKLPDGSERAAAQRDDWRAFIRALQGVF